MFVRSAEDVEDEELDGGIRRQWLSQFEFVKLFTALPEPRFISWLRLWYRLPAMEKGIGEVVVGEGREGRGTGRGDGWGGEVVVGEGQVKMTILQSSRRGGKLLLM